MKVAHFDVSWPLSARRRFHWAVSLMLLTSMLLMMTGCGGSTEAKNTVGGKVTLDGQNVAGVVTFVWPDNKDASSPIGPNGEYIMLEPKPGQVKVVVKGTGAVGIKPVGAPAGAGTPEMPAMKSATVGANPPAKYETAATTPLTFEVKTGKQKFDITLSP